jgi:hypothetical protein
MPPSEPIPTAPFYLIVADHDRGFFSVEGPMTGNASWNQAVIRAQEHGRRVECGPSGLDRDTLAAEFQRQAQWMRGVPPGTIVSPRG